MMEQYSLPRLQLYVSVYFEKQIPSREDERPQSSQRNSFAID
jgi:hypothetical protein